MITVFSSAGDLATVTATTVSNGVLGVAGDLVAMDDFLFAEPVAVPEPATLTLVLLAGLLVLSCFRGLRKRSG